MTEWLLFEVVQLQHHQSAFPLPPLNIPHLYHKLHITEVGFQWKTTQHYSLRLISVLFKYAFVLSGPGYSLHSEKATSFLKLKPKKLLVSQ